MSFSIEQVREASTFLQQHMIRNMIISMTANECAEMLAINNILSSEVGPALGFNLRQMLRDGRDGKIPLVDGTFQEAPNKQWIAYRIDKFPDHLYKHMKSLGVIYISETEIKNINKEK